MVVTSLGGPMDASFSLGVRAPMLPIPFASDGAHSTSGVDVEEKPASSVVNEFTRSTQDSSGSSGKNTTNAIYRAGNGALNRKYLLARALRNASIPLGIIFPSFLGYVSGDAQFGMFIGFFSLLASTGVLSSVDERLQETHGYLTARGLEKYGLFQEFPFAGITIEGITGNDLSRDMAAWFNLLVSEAKVDVTDRLGDHGYLKSRESRFSEILNRGRSHLDIKGQREVNFVQLLSEDMLTEFLGLISRHPKGVSLFQYLAHESPVAAKMNEDPTLMRGRKIHWTVDLLSRTEASHAMQWLVDHGNTDIVKFVKEWSDGGHVGAKWLLENCQIPQTDSIV